MHGKTPLWTGAGLIALACLIAVWLSQRPSTMPGQKHKEDGAQAIPEMNVAASHAIASNQASPGFIPDAEERNDYSRRVVDIQSMSSTLSIEEVQSLYSRLLVPSPVSMPARHYENWLRNEMMNKVEMQKALPTGWADVLIAIHKDKGQDVVMRDYAVQHMAPIYDRASELEKELLRGVLWEAAGESDSSIAGTALLALEGLARTHAEISRNRIGELALQLAGDGSCGELSRITAIRICGALELNQAASLVMDLARNGSTVPLRVAAIGALRDLGGPDSQTFLEQIAKDGPRALIPAALSAMDAMRNTQETPVELK